MIRSDDAGLAKFASDECRVRGPAPPVGDDAGRSTHDWNVVGSRTRGHKDVAIDKFSHRVRIRDHSNNAPDFVLPRPVEDALSSDSRNVLTLAPIEEKHELIVQGTEERASL